MKTKTAKPTKSVTQTIKDGAKSITKKITKRLVRKPRTPKAPVITDARVRFDGSEGKWAILDSDNQPLQHFDSGRLTNCVFKSYQTYMQQIGCGPGNELHIGTCTGDLQIGDLGDDHTAYKNLKFVSGKFADYNGNLINTAKSVLLLPNRRAMYQE